MLFECGHVLIQIEEPLDSDFDLSLSQVGERRLKQVCDELLHVLDVRLTAGLNGWVERNCDFVGLNDVEHVGQYVSLHH